MQVRVSVLTSVATLVALVACGKPAEDHPNEPTIITDRDSLGFGQEFNSGVYIGTSKQESLLIQNDGLQPLTIERIDKTGDSEFSMELPPELKVPGLGHTFVRFFFTPKEEKTYHGTITIVSDAKNQPQKVIQLSGRGVKPGSADGGM